MTDRYPAQLFDGSGPRPVEGELLISLDRLTFTPRGGTPRTIPLDAIRHIRRFSEGTHISLDAPEPGLPEWKLVAVGEDLEEQVDELRGRYGSGTQARRVFLKRVPLSVWILVACIVIPLGYISYTRTAVYAHRFIPIEQEAKIGAGVYKLMDHFSTPTQNPELSALIQRMVDELKDPDSPYTYQVRIYADSTPNAFAAPGGYIAVFTGLLDYCDTPDALAGVLAHEIAHVEQRHSMQQLCRSAGTLFFFSALVGGGFEELEMAEMVSELSGMLILLNYSREHERESDHLAVDKLHRAGYSAQGMLSFFEKLAASEFSLDEEVESKWVWISTHPATDERIEYLEKAQLPAGQIPKTWMRPARWKSLKDQARKIPAGESPSLRDLLKQDAEAPSG